MLNIEDTDQVFSEAAAPFPFPPATYEAPISAHPCQHLSFSTLLDDSILVGVPWLLIVVLICIPLTASDGEHLLTCFLAICMSSSVRFLFYKSHEQGALHTSRGGVSQLTAITPPSRRGSKEGSGGWDVCSHLDTRGDPAGSLGGP